MAKPFFKVNANKPVVVDLEKLHKTDLFFVEGGRLYTLSPFRPGGVFILQEVIDVDTLVRLGLRESELEGDQNEGNPEGDENVPEVVPVEEESEEESEDEAV